MSRSSRWAQGLSVVALAAAILWSGAAFAQSDRPKQKIKLNTLNDLPRHTYKLAGSVSELLRSDEQFAAFAAKVRADTAGDLEKYEIADATTLQRLYGVLLGLDMLEGRYDDALTRIGQIRALENKEALKLTMGLTSEALIAARRETGQDLDDPAMRAAFRNHLAVAVGRLPWDIVQEEIKQSKGRAEIFSENLLMGVVQGRWDPIAAKSGEISSDIADGVVRMRYALKLRLPLKQELVGVYQDVIDRHRVAKRDIWPARAVTLRKAQSLKPVVIGVWDSGVDTPIFEGQLFVNPQEKLDGKDNDGNGFVDDVHGIAFDLDGKRTPEMLYPLGAAAGRIDSVMKHVKGFVDTQAAIESPEASALKRHIAGLEEDRVDDFVEDLNLCSNYMHGTHVAGIAIDGNPFARILIARNMFDYHMIPKPLTIEIAQRHAQSYRATTRYFKAHDVRAVNMSWGWTLKEIESGLEANGVGETADERAKLAGEILSILSRGLHDAIQGAPEILFVSSAGNEDSDVEFDEVIPSSFDLPNLLIVAAVDQAGEPTSFTSFGRNVVVYANGFEVESYVPGGERMKASGTSMSAPNVTNLAAKLIALKPTLKPSAVIELIKKGADRKEGAPPYLLLNPQRSVELLREEQ
ncbi:MAG: S8 family serine peptidase [Phycisphaerae bacterium]